jgi:hypothetical protein
LGKRCDPGELPEQNRGDSDVLVFDAGDNTEPIAVSVGAFPQTARDAKPGKIRGHATIIDRIIG